MKPSNLEAVNRSFELQAPGFESSEVPFTKETYLEEMISYAAPEKQDVVLEVAAGTCACGRSFAPLVQTVVCLDATLSMLQVGKREADLHRLHNMVFVKGCAEELPFLDASFDLVFSRLAFHHFTETDVAFSEMARVSSRSYPAFVPSQSMLVSKISPAPSFSARIAHSTASIFMSTRPPFLNIFQPLPSSRLLASMATTTH